MQSYIKTLEKSKFEFKIFGKLHFHFVLDPFFFNVYKTKSKIFPSITFMGNVPWMANVATGIASDVALGVATGVMYIPQDWVALMSQPY